MMFKRITVALATMLIASSTFAQNTEDLEQRLKALQDKVATIEEMKREIDVLTQEIETLKSGATRKPVEADQAQFGLGAAASKVYRSESGVSFGGYGEFLYQNFDGTAVSRADALRVILYNGYKFNDRVLFNSEVEYEHANTERSGEVEVEFAYLDYLVKPSINIRSGLLLMPVGLTNEQHEPTAYLGARRPIVDSRIIPTTWSELGVGAFGDVGPVTYRAYLTTGLTSESFTATGIRGGRQMGSSAKANDLAAVGRLDWHPIEGTMIGGSLYAGKSGQDRSYGGRVTLGEVHARAQIRGLQASALFARGTVDDAAAINAANNLKGPAGVGERFGGWYVEGGYDVFKSIGHRDMSLTPYARYERLDTQRRVPAGFSRNPANDQKIFTVGFAFKPISQTVVKVDWQNVDNRANTGVNQFNIALGYIF